MQRVQFIDSHTGGEPTRVITGGGPDWAGASPSEARSRLAEELDWFRRATVCEPRGNDVLVGAVLLPPRRPDAVAGVVFFNNVGVIQMCVHGTIGVAVTLAHLGRLSSGATWLETPVGDVEIELLADGRVRVTNVVSRRWRHDVEVATDAGMFHGDVAWGGNWFFLVEETPVEICYENREALTQLAWSIRHGLEAAGVAGEDGPIDHIELFGPPLAAGADSKNFVLCPGGAYDRSPCGTGTSAKLACLAADGRLAPGEVWRQEGIVGSVFEGSYREVEGGISPSIVGEARLTAEGELLIDPNDHFRHGFNA